MCYESNLVSIVVPVYNMGNSIDESVKSIIEQDYKNIEIILIDDGSKDDSYSHCQELEKKDSRIKAFHTENRGSGPARNYGIQVATGRYIYFPDADDILERNAISTMLSAVNSEYDLIVFGYRSYDVKGKCRLNKIYPEMRLDGASIRLDYSDYMGSSSRYGIQGAPWNKLFDLQVIKKNNIEFPSLRRHQDDSFIARYMCYVAKVHFIPQVLYNHYLNDLYREWDKYPVDYVDVVIGLYATRKETILGWNPEDVKTHEIVKSEYVCNVIKSLELSFSPKMRNVIGNQKEWIIEQVNRTHILEFIDLANLGKYQKVILRLLKARNLSTALLLMRIKIEFEKIGLLNYIRR